MTMAEIGKASILEGWATVSKGEQNHRIAPYLWDFRCASSQAETRISFA